MNNTYTKKISVSVLAQITIAIIIAVALSLFLIQSETNRVRSDVAIYAKHIHNYIDDQTRLYETALEGFSSYLSAEQGLKIDNAREYVRKLRKQYPEIYKMQVSRRITHAERNSFEKEMQQAGYPDFNIHVFAYDDDRTFRPSEPRDIYYPIVFIEPELAESKGVLGLDFAETSSILNEALHRSAKLGAQVASMPFHLIENKVGYILYSPVSRFDEKKASINETTLTATYYALLVVNTPSLLSDEMKNRKGISISISTRDPDSGDYVDVFSTNNKSKGSVLSGILPSFDFTFTNKTASQPFLIKVNYSMVWEDINVSIIIGANITVLLIFVIVFVLSNIQHRREIGVIEKRNASLQNLTVKAKESEMHLRTLVQSLPGLVWVKNAEGVYLNCNPKFERLYGHTEAEIIGKTDYDFVDKELADFFRKHDENAMAAGKATTNEEELTFANDGHKEITETVKTPIYTSDGALIGVLGVGHDITKRSDDLFLANKELAFQMEEKVKERTRELGAIFTLSPDGFVLVNADNNIVYINPALLEITNFKEEAFVGKNAETLCKSMATLHDSALMKDESLIKNEDCELLVFLSLPTKRVLNCNQKIMHGITGEIEGHVLYFRDVTHETEVDKMKSEFLSTAAHELRTPLASIFGFSELLLHRDYDAVQSKDMVEIIHRQSFTLTKVLDELLDLSRIEARAGKDCHMENNSLEDVLKQSCGEIEGAFTGRKVERQSLEHWPIISFDTDKMHQVFNNLLSNGFKYSPENENVILKTSEREHNGKSQFGVSIIDNGIGMTPKQLVLLGERFYRADDSGSTPETGLGVSLVKEIVAIHGGEIEFVSANGKGMAVTVWLPIV